MSDSDNNRATCLVVGAGLTGLVAARELQRSGMDVTVLDKGRGVGGRRAMRRIGEWVFDHGAQFFTVRDAKFKLLRESKTNTACPWKGQASYYDVVVYGDTNKDAA